MHSYGETRNTFKNIFRRLRIFLEFLYKKCVVSNWPRNPCIDLTRWPIPPRPFPPSPVLILFSYQWQRFRPLHCGFCLHYIVRNVHRLTKSKTSDILQQILWYLIHLKYKYKTNSSDILQQILWHLIHLK